MNIFTKNVLSYSLASLLSFTVLTAPVLTSAEVNIEQTDN